MHTVASPPRPRLHTRGSPVSASPLSAPLPQIATSRRRSSGSASCRCLSLLALALVTSAGLVTLTIVTYLRARPAEQSLSGLGQKEAPESTGVPDTTKKSEVLAAIDEEGPDNDQSEKSCQTIVFFHIPKTGGESMNRLWEGRKRVLGWNRYRMLAMRTSEDNIPALPSMSIRDQSRFMEMMSPWSHNKTIYRHNVLELHCGRSISFSQAQWSLRIMRENHESNGCGFFAFTLMRSPLEWIVSLYDDICHRRLRGHKDTCPQTADMTSKQEMLKFPHSDGMVSYLTHGWKGWASPGPVNRRDVQALKVSLESELDLVAFTEHVPQLRRYLTERFATSNGKLTEREIYVLKQGSVANRNTMKTVKLSDFNHNERARLNATVQLDWELYRNFEGKPLPW